MGIATSEINMINHKAVFLILSYEALYVFMFEVFALGGGMREGGMGPMLMLILM